MSAGKRPRGQQVAAKLTSRFEEIVKPSTARGDYEAVARLIVAAPPTWLVDILVAWSPSVWLQARVLDLQPSRAKMRAYLRWFDRTVSALRKALGEPPVRGFLDAAADEKIEYHGAIDAYLRDLGARATRALASPELATAAGKTKAGKGVALPPGALHAASFCAVIVVETWKYVRGAYPGPRNAKAAAAAEAYWTACGNTRNSWGANPLNAWRRRFEEAMSPSYDSPRGEIVRTILEAERIAGLMALPATPGADSNPPSQRLDSGPPETLTLQS